MSKVIKFIEKLGQDAQLRHASRNDMELALSREPIEPEVMAALLSGDQNQLSALLGAHSNVYCLIAPGKERDDDSEDAPAKDDEEIAAQHSLPGVASTG